MFWRVVLVNAAVLVGAVVVLAVSPASVSAAPTAAEIEVLIAGTALVIGLNVLLLRRIFVPLERLTGTMRRVDPHDPGRRVTMRRPAAVRFAALNSVRQTSSSPRSWPGLFRVKNAMCGSLKRPAGTDCSPSRSCCG